MQGLGAFWLIVLLAATAGFGAMVTICGILGFADILGLFALLKAEPDTLHGEAPEAEGEAEEQASDETKA